MLTLHTSHKTEYLLAHLIHVMQNNPLPTAFDQEVFLIQSQGMERWLSQELANAFGVWANSEFLFPAKFFNRMSNLVDVALNAGVFERDYLVWEIEAILRDLPTTADDSVFDPLRQYLLIDASALRRYELAQQIAQIFDEYQIMRPDMLEAWSKQQLTTQNPAETWQMALWKLLTAKLSQESQLQLHRGQIWQSAIDKLKNNRDPELTARLPKRISVFGISTLPPLFLEFIHALATQTEIHLYLMQPCKEYWADIPGIKETRLAKLTSVVSAENLPHDSDSMHPFDIEDSLQNPLLSLLGQQGREFHQMLLERGDIDWQVDSFDAFSLEQTTLLTQLQDRILDNDYRPVEFCAEDHSIQCVSCHSEMREIQVLKDYLLEQLQTYPDLELRDIAVMAPDISKYEPFISAVFDDPRFAYTIADRSLRSSNEILDIFIKLLQAFSSRFEWDKVLDLLEQPVVHQNFGLSDDDLEWIRCWVHDTHIRWGKDAEHKARLQLPALAQNTWDAGLRQMMDGFIERGTGIEIEGSIAQALGTLDHFVRNILFHYSNRLQSPRTLGQWHELLLELLDKVCGENSYGHRLQLRELIANLTTLPQEQTYPLEVIIKWLESSVGEQKTSQGFLSGQMTFCSILPMRSIPFKIICLIGLNENDFPKLDRKPSFDLMGSKPAFRTGDRSNRKDNRYQFLDALLSTRQSLYLSYIGQSIRSNRDIPPSVVISELLDMFSIPKEQSMIQKHPLQPFSKTYFDALYTFDQASAEAAKAFSNKATEPKKWWDWQNDSRPSTSVERVSLQDFLQFFRDPQKYFVENIIDIRFQALTESVQTTERFTLNALENFQINDTLLKAQLADNLTEVQQRLQTSGQWMQGSWGEITLAQQTQQTQPLAQLIQHQLKQLGEKRADHFTEIELNSVRLEGWVQNLYQHGRLFYRAGTLKAKYLIQYWIQHLIDSRPSFIVGLDPKSKNPICYQLPILEFTERQTYLNALMDTYLQGQSTPSSLWIEPAWSYVNGKPEAQVSAAQKALDSVLNGDFTAREIQVLTQGYAPEAFLSDEFETLAVTLMSPIQHHLQPVEENLQ